MSRGAATRSSRWCCCIFFSSIIASRITCKSTRPATMTSSMSGTRVACGRLALSVACARSTMCHFCRGATATLTFRSRPPRRRTCSLRPSPDRSSTRACRWTRRGRCSCCSVCTWLGASCEIARFPRGALLRYLNCAVTGSSVPFLSYRFESPFPHFISSFCAVQQRESARNGL